MPSQVQKVIASRGFIVGAFLWACATTAPATKAALAPTIEGIHDALASDQKWTPYWFWGWGGTFAASGVVQLTLEGLAEERGPRVDAATGAVSSWLGVIGLGIGQLQPEVTIPDAEDMTLMLRSVRAQARREAAARGWVSHVLCAAVAVGSGLYLWLGEDRPVHAAINFGLNLGVGEAQIWTVPTASLDWWTETFPGEDP